MAQSDSGSVGSALNAPARTSRAGSAAKHTVEMMRRALGESRFRARVSDVSGRQIRIRRIGHEEIEGPYPAAAGLAASVNTGDVVICERVGGRVSVAREEVT